MPADWLMPTYLYTICISQYLQASTSWYYWVQ